MKALTKLKDDARKHEQKEEWDKAVQLYLEVIRTAEEGEGDSELPLYNRVGDLYVRMGKPIDAVTFYEKAADRYAEAGLFNNAIALCNKALRYLPNRTELLRKLGQFSASQGFITEARRWYLEYAERKLKEGALDEAFQSLDDFASVHEDADVREMLGRQLLAHNRRDHALLELKKAHELRVAAGQTDAAVRLMDEILTIEPNAFSDAPPSSAPAAPAIEPPPVDSWADPGISPPASGDAISLEAAPEVHSAPAADPGLIDLSSLDLPGFESGAGAGAPEEVLAEPPADGFAGISDIPEAIDPGLIEIQPSVPEFQGAAAETDFAPMDLGVIDFGDGNFDASVQSLEAPEPAPSDAQAVAGPDELSGPADLDASVFEHPDAVDEPLPFLDTGALEESEPFDLPLLEDPIESPAVEPLPFLEPEKETVEPAAFEAPAPPDVADGISDAIFEQAEEPTVLPQDLPALEIPPYPAFEPAPVEPGPAATPEPLAFEIEELDVVEVPAAPDPEDADFGTAPGFEVGAEPLEAELADAGEPAPMEFPDATSEEPADGLDDIAMPAVEAAGFETVEAPPAYEAAITAEAPAQTADFDFGSDYGIGDGLESDAEFGDVADQELVPDWTETLAAARDFARRGETAAAIEEMVILHEALAADGMYAEALQVIDELVRLEPGSIGHLQQRVEYATRAGDTSALIRAYLELADRLARSGSTAKANAIYQRVLDIDPNNAIARNAVYAPPPPVQTSAEGYVDLFSLLSDDEQADTRFVVAEKPPTGDEERDFADMLAQFKQKLAEHVPFDDSSSHYDLGLAFKEMGLIDEAIAEFQTALKGGQDRLKIYEELGQCFLLKQQYNIAITILNRALAMGVDDADLVGVYYHIGRSYEELGQRTEAKNAFERVVGVDISFKDAAERLSRL